MKKNLKSFKMLVSFTMLIFIFLSQANLDVRAANVNLPINDTFVDGNITQAGSVDYYTIVLPSAGWLTLTYQGWSIGSSHIALLNGNQTKTYYVHNMYFSSDTNPLTDIEKIPLEEGTYIAKVYGGEPSYGGAAYIGSYKIKAAFSPANNNETEPNDYFYESMDLDENEQVMGFLSADDMTDFYKIETPSDTVIRVTVRSRIENDSFCSHLVSVYDSEYILQKEKTLIGSSSSPVLNTIDVALKKGVNYIKVASDVDAYYGAKGCYQLEWKRIITPVDSITITGPKSVKIGKSVNLEARVTPDTADNKEIKWVSYNPLVASVDKEGKVTGIKAGDVQIRAEATDGSGVYSVHNMTVEATTVPVTNISINGNNRIMEGDSTILEAIVTPDDATDRSVTWSSSDDMVATVDADGNVTGKNTGTVYIYARANDGSGIYGVFEMTVLQRNEDPDDNIYVSGIVITGEKTLKAGSSIKLIATISPENATQKKVTWSSSNTSIAEVNGKGKVTAIKAGKVTIKASALDGSGVYGSYKVTVIPKNADPAASKIVKKVSSVKGKATGSKKVKVSWIKQKSAIRYEIQISTGNTFKKNLVTKIAPKSKNNLTIKCKKKGKSYIRVRAVDKYGFVGKWSKVKTVKVK